MSRWIPLFALALSACNAGGVQPAAAPAHQQTPAPLANSSAPRSPGKYFVVPLVSDGYISTPVTDPHLVNAWGLVSSPTSPWWVADNGTSVSTLYTGAGAPLSLVVNLPGGANGGQAAPTGIVFNGGGQFVITDGTHSSPARFIFASEDGTLSAWSGATGAVLAADESLDGAVFKGLAIATTAAGDLLFATNFASAAVEVFDGSFHRTTTEGSWIDPMLPAGFAPFGIRTIGEAVYVTYAKKAAEGNDEVDRPSLGFVSAFDTSGNFLARIASRGRLNAPWGLALAPAGFGAASGRLIVGNFGDGELTAFAPAGTPGIGPEGDELGQPLLGANGPLVIDGLWGLGFGNGASAGPANQLYFAAGPADETHGLFGYIAVAAQ